MQDAKDFVLSELEIGVEQIVIPKTVFYILWNRNIYRFLCYCCVDPLNAMHTAHDEHHFPLFFICCELLAAHFALQHEHEHNDSLPVFR
jgi:hypothetical protein